MDSVLIRRVDLLSENYQMLKDRFKWDPPLVKYFGAMVYAMKEQNIDAEKIDEIKKYIKEHTSWTSYFRTTNSFMLSCLLSFEQNYEQFFNDMMSIFEKMKEDGIKNSLYTPWAAYIIAKEVQMGDYDFKIKRMKEFYSGMKKKHFFITSSDDYVFSAILSITDLDVDAALEKIEEIYNFLNKLGFGKGNALQTLSHVLVLGEEDTNIKCERAVEIYKKLKEKKCSFKYSDLSSLGVLTLICDDIDKIVSDVKEVYDYIYTKKGFGFWNMASSVRTILSSNIVSSYYINGAKQGILPINLANSINSIIIAQNQVAIVAACSAGAAAASSNS
ncbi:MAG: DUF4003 domain-containing protein [Caloramator sp.]|nr:DUF4003 domain-containing protein [Caloramator sp.]